MRGKHLEKDAHWKKNCGVWGKVDQKKFGTFFRGGRNQ